jgi:hypothetical protein
MGETPMPDTTGPVAADPGNSGPESWAVPLTADELADVLAVVDDPDPIVLAGLAGTLYDPEGGTDGQAS